MFTSLPKTVDTLLAALGLTYARRPLERDNLLVRIHLIIVMIRWTGLAPWV